MPRAGTRCSRASRAPRPSSRSSTCAPCTPRPAPSPRPGGRRTSCSSKTAASWSPPARSTSRTIRTANTCSTGPGPTPTSATASTTTPSSPARCRSRRCPGRACWRATHEQRLAAAARHRGDRAQGRHVLAAPAVPRRRRPGRGARGRLVDAQHGPVPLAQPRAAPYADFADFLASLQRDKRKKIQQERRRVADAGVTLHAARGSEIGADDWDFFYRCYTRTYRGAPLHALPDPRLLRPRGEDDAASTGCCSPPARRRAASPAR